METTLMGNALSLADDRWGQLRSRIQGTVIGPDDPEYDETRKAWNLAVNQHPAVIVVAAGAGDVIEAVRVAIVRLLCTSNWPA